MAYVETLRLTLRHDYYRTARVPVTFRPADARRHARAGLLLRSMPNGLLVIRDSAEDDMPSAVHLDLVADDPAVFAVSEGAQWRQSLHLRVGLARDQATLSDARVVASDDTDIRRALLRLSVALPRSGARDLTLNIAAVRTHWAYHVVQSRPADGLAVVDTQGAMAFDDLGDQPLPDGRQARVLRTADPIALRARSPARFALQKAGPFGPETIIQTLPVPGTEFKTLPQPQPGAAARLQSDIYVTLL